LDLEPFDRLQVALLPIGDSEKGNLKPES